MDTEPTNTIPGYMPPELHYEAVPALPPAMLTFRGSSMDQAKLVAALAAARLEFGQVEKSRTGQYGNQKFSYAPLGVLTAATADALAKHGVFVMQHLTTSPRDRSKHCITTCVTGHGAMITSELDFAPQQAKEDGAYKGEWIKEYGKLTTYLRRYMYQSIFVLDAEPDADEAGDAPEPRYAPRREAPTPQPRPEPQRAAPPAQRPATIPPPPPVPAQPELRVTDDSGPADKDTLEQLNALCQQLGMKTMQFNSLCDKTVGMAFSQLRGSQAAAQKVMEAMQRMVLDRSGTRGNA